jgi:hypothetical protein
MRPDFPRVIWDLWLQGWRDPPEIVSACRRTWERHNRGWTLVPLSKESACRLLAGSDALRLVADKPLPPEALSDVIRIELLRRYGGVWADATTYCLRPLDDWLSERLTSGFFAFANPAPDRMLSSWFLAATTDNLIVAEWAMAVADYWLIHDERHTYFWFHYLFAKCYRKNEGFRRVWDRTPTIHSDGPRYFFPQTETLLKPLAAADRELLEGMIVPLVKLRHNLPEGPVPAGSVLRYLCARANSEMPEAGATESTGKTATSPC